MKAWMNKWKNELISELTWTPRKSLYLIPQIQTTLIINLSYKPDLRLNLVSSEDEIEK